MAPPADGANAAQHCSPLLVIQPGPLTALPRPSAGSYFVSRLLQPGILGMYLVVVTIRIISPGLGPTKVGGVGRKDLKD